MIAGRFRSQILDGSMAAGQRLPRQEVLARELGVSLTVAREALRMLEAQGLITVHRGKTGGATVRVPDGAALAAALAAVAARARIAPADTGATVAALDGLCARTAAAQPDRATVVRRLEDSLDAQRRLAGDEAAFGPECARFHAAISHGCGLAMLQAMCDALATAARPLGHAAARRCERGEPQLDAERILADHTRAVRAVASGDGPAAASAAGHRDGP